MVLICDTNCESWLVFAQEFEFIEMEAIMGFEVDVSPLQRGGVKSGTESRIIDIGPQ